VSLNEVTAADARAAGLTQIGGAKVSSFPPDQDSPAQKAGIEVGDIIVSAAGRPVDQVSTLQRIIRGFKPGDVVDIDVMRFGQKKNFKIKLAEVAEPANQLAEAVEDRETPVRGDNNVARTFDKLGIGVAPVSAELIQRTKMDPAYRNGLLIANVSARGPAWRTLFEGEIIVGVLYPTKRDVKSAEDLASALNAVKPGDVITLKLYNTPAGGQSGQTRVVSVQIPR
jgi:serine protease Do